MFRFDGRSALVTGATSGIGAALADALEDGGARVTRHGVEPDAPLVADLADADAVEALAEATSAVDILVLAASVQSRERWDEIAPDEVRRQLEVNMLAPLRVMQRIIPGMRSRGWGRVVALTSVQLTRPHPDMAAYAASKSALASIVRNVARQAAPDGVTVNMLSPGVIETPRNSDALADAEYRRRVLAAVPAGRAGTAGDCVGAALLLCSDAGAYITGHDLVVDGGMSL